VAERFFVVVSESGRTDSAAAIFAARPFLEPAFVAPALVERMFAV
jgi:hypothetical protein